MDWDEPVAVTDGLLYDAPLLSIAEERELFTRYGKTHERSIRDQLILANTRLVRQLAWGFARRHTLDSLTVEDLIQEGMFGLMTAIEKFDVLRGWKFSTYATRWIRQAIGRAFEEKAKTVREPSYLQMARRKARREGHEHDSGLPPMAVVFSLDAPAGSDPANDPLREFIASGAPDVTERVVERVFWRETLYVALGRLTARQQLVVALRYGLGDGTGNDDEEPLTLEECGRLLGVTRERVRQIEAKALTHLRLWLRETGDGDVALRMLTLVEQTRTAQIRKAAAAQRAQKKRPTKPTKQTRQTTQTSRVA